MRIVPISSASAPPVHAASAEIARRRPASAGVRLVGATADASNPLLAKLNGALFTARATGEGGTGDLIESFFEFRSRVRRALQIATSGGRAVLDFAEAGGRELGASGVSVPFERPTFDALYEEHFDFVWRNLRRLGVPDTSGNRVFFITLP